MALTDFQEHFDNAYEETFQRALVAKTIMNTRFEEKLKYGESVERFMFDISGVRVRSTSRGSASTIDTVTDSTELLTINLEKEAVFHISDGEAKQAGPLNPGEVIGKDIALKVAIDLDARCFGEVLNAAYDFDNGDLTTSASTGTGITLSSTTVPQMTTRMAAKLKNKNNVETMSNMALVVDAYAAADIEQYLLGKDIDIAGSVFKNGYAGSIRNATLYVSENLTGEVVLTATGNFSNGEAVVINGVTFNGVTTIGSTAGNFLVNAADRDITITNLTGLINDPTTTSATQVALSTADAETVEKWTATASAANDTMTVVMVGSGRPVVSETCANASFTTKHLHCYFGKKGAIDLVVQDMKEVDMRKTDDRRGTNVFSSYLAGIKTFTDGSKKFLDVILAV